MIRMLAPARRGAPLGLSLGLLFVAGLAVFAAPRAGALPLYASRQGATCNTCHVDPNGGGIRNEFGFAYGRNRHSTEPEERWTTLSVDPKLNDWITLGLDVRVMYRALHRNGADADFDDAQFYPMQGQVNLAVMPHEHLTLVASHGLALSYESGTPSEFVGRETYGMIEGLPGGSYARVGRFRLPFGLRQEDHTSFTRNPTFLTYDAQKPSAGLEVGRIGARWFVQASIVNDNDSRAERYAAKIGYASPAFQAALSGFHDTNPGRDDHLWSAYASATRGPVTLLGEYVGGTVAAGVFLPPNRETFFTEVVYRAGRGVNLRAKLDYGDISKGEPSGLARRYLGEIDLNPVPFMETKLSYRYHDDEDFGIDQEYLILAYFPF